MKNATYDQIKDLAVRVLNLNKGKLDGAAYDRGTQGFSNEDVANRLIAFVNNGLSFIMKGPSALIIDRTRSFNPVTFFGNDWTIWRGAKESDGLTGEEAQDATSLALAEIDFAKALFTVCLKEGETTITGEEKLVRHIAAKHVRLDARVGQCLFEEKGQATLEWLYQNFGITWFELPGTVLRNSDGDRCFLYLFRSGDGRWGWDCCWLDYVRRAGGLSAVLASSTQP